MYQANYSACGGAETGGLPLRGVYREVSEHLLDDHWFFVAGDDPDGIAQHNVALVGDFCR